MATRTKTNKLDSKNPDDIKEKTYLTRHVETSISILESPENDIVLEALLFLSKYADIRLVNLTYLQQKGLLKKLLNLFDRNICILRLALRLLDILLSIDDVMVEFNQGIYDEEIKRITGFYIRHDDNYVREFSVNILIKLATTCRITSLIFSVDLLIPILQTLQGNPSEGVLKTTIRLLYVLLSSPAVLSFLPELQKFDVTVILDFMKNHDKEISEVTFQIVEKLTMFSLDVYQNIFRFHHLVEKMMEVVMDDSKKDMHETALQIILNCLNSDLTSSYFVESLQFLQFCLWVKTCDPMYLSACVQIFAKLSSMPEIRQMLFDLSVEESILLFFRSNNKYVLNQACEAISNMSEHQYCCEQMLTPVVVRVLCDMMTEDPECTVAIKTITCLLRRSLKTIELLNFCGAQQTLIDMFRKGPHSYSEENYLRIVEILYQFAIHPTYQETVVCGKFFEELINLIQQGRDDMANLCIEMLTYFIPNNEFMGLFLKNQGPAIVIEKLKKTENQQLFRSLLVFIHCTLTNESIITEYIRNNLVGILKSFSEPIKLKIPLIDTILYLTYDIYLPLKFFEMKRIDITDKLNNKFYIVTGKWTGPFPFLDMMERDKNCPIRTIYLVDFSFQVAKHKHKSRFSHRNLPKVEDMENELMSLSEYKIFDNDPFLPTYIQYAQQNIQDIPDTTEKIQALAEYVNSLLCGPSETATMAQKFHTFQLHLQTLKYKFGSNIIPLGFLRIGFHCEKSLLFKALADRLDIPCSLVKGHKEIYWNEVAVFSRKGDDQVLTICVVDLMDKIGKLMPRGGNEANYYCNSTKFSNACCKKSANDVD